MPYQKTFKLAGAKFHNLHKVLEQVEEGDGLDLVPEPDNKYDPNAIKVLWEGTMIGYIPRVFSAEVAGLLESGAELGARIDRLNKDAKPWDQVTLIVEDIDEDNLDEDSEEE